STVYTAPTSPGEPHVWTIGANAVQGLDHAVAYNGPGAMVCDTDVSNSAGVDAVVRLPKASDTSIGWVRLEPTSTSVLVADLRDGCDPMDGAASSLACGNVRTFSGSTPDRMLETMITGAAGDRFLWMATERSYEDFPGAIVRYNEIEPLPGDSCATAIP